MKISSEGRGVNFRVVVMKFGGRVSEWVFEIRLQDVISGLGYESGVGDTKSGEYGSD